MSSQGFRHVLTPLCFDPSLGKEGCDLRKKSSPNLRVPSSWLKRLLDLLSLPWLALELEKEINFFLYRWRPASNLPVGKVGMRREYLLFWVASCYFTLFTLFWTCYSSSQIYFDTQKRAISNYACLFPLFSSQIFWIIGSLIFDWHSMHLSSYQQLGHSLLSLSCHCEIGTSAEHEKLNKWSITGQDVGNNGHSAAECPRFWLRYRFKYVLPARPFMHLASAVATQYDVGILELIDW